MRSDDATTVLLVHGAFHGAWCWDPVVDLLRAEGIGVEAVDLPGHGSSRDPVTDLHGDAVRVRDALDADGGSVVLVGHSYGGAVITEAGTHPRVAHLVYIAALMIDADESCMTAAGRDPKAATIDHTTIPDLGAALVVADDGTATVDPAQAGEIFFNDVDVATAADAVARLGPQSMAALGQSPVGVAWRDRPSTYVICEQDNTLHPDLQRILAERATHTVTWPTGHSPFLSRPDLVVALLQDLTRP